MPDVDAELHLQYEESGVNEGKLLDIGRSIVKGRYLISPAFEENRKRMVSPPDPPSLGAFLSVALFMWHSVNTEL